jgi:hypothetical protein
VAHWASSQGTTLKSIKSAEGIARSRKPARGPENGCPDGFYRSAIIQQLLVQFGDGSARLDFTLRGQVFPKIWNCTVIS